MSTLGTLTCASRPDQFFTGTRRNDMIVYHGDPTMQLVLGVNSPSQSNNAIYITSSNVQINTPLIASQILSPNTGTLTLTPSTTSPPVTMVNETGHVYQVTVVAQGGMATVCIVSGTTVTYMTAITTTVSVDSLGQVTLTNNLTTSELVKWTVTRII